MICILILGGTRYIGKGFIDLLEQDTHIKLFVASRNKPSYLKKGQWLKCNRENINDLINIANLTFYDIVFDHFCFNEDHAQIACEAFRNRIGHYVMISSQAVYPQGMFHLESAYNPYELTINQLKTELEDYPLHRYSIGKRCAETTFYHIASFPVTTIRFPIVLDESDLRLQVFIHELIKTNIFYAQNGSALLSLISLNEACHFLNFILNHLPGQPINAASDHPLSIVSLFENFANFIPSLQILEWPIPINHKYDVHIYFEYIKNLSFLSISDHWTISNEYAKSIGFQFDSIYTWFPNVVENCQNIIKNQMRA